MLPALLQAAPLANPALLHCSTPLHHLCRHDPRTATVPIANHGIGLLQSNDDWRREPVVVDKRSLAVDTRTALSQPKLALAADAFVAAPIKSLTY